MLRIIFIISTLHVYCYGFLRPAGRYEKPLRFETLYDTIVQTETKTYTEYSTCTKTALDIPLCQSFEQSRQKRSLISVRKPRFPPRVQAVESRILLDPSNDAVESVTEPESLPMQPETENPVESVIKPKLIIIRLTSTLVTQIPATVYNTETTVGISYGGCVPTDAPKVSVCPN
ncbi:hypothetical protein Anas_00485 [Armadillidium nasatum]|uniref:Uncharacterized protein n=1 Tax=Armadillidium nasatum TaxID=96803 RepID=A0A5N5TMV7_9CRUS|nr:hypothetical protein Anas_00485 [Armadillidium nasatum]